MADETFEADVTITNTAAEAVDGWTVRWTFPGGQSLVSGRNARADQSGTRVTLRNSRDNGRIAPGATVRDVGFTAHGDVTNPMPMNVTLNGQRCAREAG